MEKRKELQIREDDEPNDAALGMDTFGAVMEGKREDLHVAKIKKSEHLGRWQMGRTSQWNEG